MLSDPLAELRRWVDDYANDEPPLRQAQMAALLPMNYFLGCWKQGLDIKEAQKEVRRMLEILHAFEGKLAIIDYVTNGLPLDD